MTLVKQVLLLSLYFVLINAKNDQKINGSSSDINYGISYHLYGLFVILASSFVGTLIPILLKKKPFFSIEGNLFNSLKMFGTGVILAVAFVHMLSPADKLLSGEDAPEFFQEKYDSFSGVFAVCGIVLGHGIQVCMKEYFKSTGKSSCDGYDQHQVHHHHFRYINDNGIDNKNRNNEKEEIADNNDMSNHSHDVHTHTHTHSHTSTHGYSTNESHVNIDDLEKNISHSNNIQINASENDLLLARKESSLMSINYHDNSSNQHDCCGAEVLILYSKKQIVSYLLEIGISMHSVLIGFTFGTNFDDELKLLLIALMFHQFFEGIALSTVFIEAKFKKFTAPLIMMIAYCSTMPLGGLLGLLVHNLIDQNSVLVACIQGILDSVAAGLLIYDSIVNILFNYTSSKNWDSQDRKSKIIQLFSFYSGIAVMSVIGLWA